MRSQEEYYELVLQNRELMKDPDNTRCTCQNTLCEWHGSCRECVALHRYHGEHIPACLQPILKDKVRALAGAVEMVTAPKEGTPIEHRRYVRARDAQAAKEPSPPQGERE